MRDPKNVAINIRVSVAERRAFQKAAEQEDQSVSDWLRRLGRKRAEELKITIRTQSLKVKQERNK